jgi:hypothetical protein
LGFLFDHRAFINQNIGLVTIAVKNPEIKDPNPMDIFHSKLMASKVACYILTFSKLLQRAMFSPQVFEFSLSATRNWHPAYHFIVVKTGVVKLHICSWWHIMKLLIEQVSGYLACGTLAA